MRVYFLAEKTCALTVGGAYLGLADGFERSAEIEPSGICVEFSPLGDLLPVRFLFDEDLLLDPPPQIVLYYTDGAVAVYACGFLRADQSLKVLWQERIGRTRLTLTLQGKLLLDFENETGFRPVELPPALEDCRAEPCGSGFLLRGKTAFALLSHAGEMTLFSEGEVLSAGETLRAIVPFHDCLGHTAVCEWKDGTLVSCSIRAAREPGEATYALALLESALIGADCTPYLSDALAPKAAALKEYLGDYRSVVLTGERDKIGLVYPRKERIFDVRYFRVTTENGKVANLTPIPSP